MSMDFLKDFQKKTVDFGVANNYSIYALQQGLGKSVCSLATAVKTNSKALIICPAYLRLKWKSEIEKFFPDKIVSLFKNDKEFYPLWDSDFAIISYHYIAKAEMLFEWADMVIVDESQNFKETSSQRSQALHQMVYENSIPRLLLLTGTPISNRTYEFYSLLALCNYDPRITKSKFLDTYPSYVDFANHFSHLEEFEMYRGNKRVKVQRWNGYKNLDELKEYTKNCYIRFTTDEVLDLPPITEIEVPVSYEDRPELMAAFDRFTASAGEGDKVHGVDARAKANAALAKASFTVSYVKGLIESDEQVVVYSDHVAACEKIAEGLGVVGITGSTPMPLRQEMADKFMAGESKVIVATIGSFSTGIDLFSSSNMVFNDPAFVPGWMEQAQYRIRRIGQKNRCNFHFILGSIQDQKIYKILKEKMETINAVI